MTFLKSVLAVLMLSIAICAAVLITGEKKQTPESKTEYVLRYENGQVSLFTDGKISQSFDGISFDTLPYADRQSLKEGIKMTSYEEILNLVEDFDG